MCIVAIGSAYPKALVISVEDGTTRTRVSLKENRRLRNDKQEPEQRERKADFRQKE
ncbi:hypothetical protein KSF_100660 [Reticulibacter mediterranei]|uniref:Uncharacterized protein n=1 Tax=Reticulibacter mediterranei TaxID=2778369 RepID=A0A8J3IWY5_9CHLR|nr:hypothetical protein KSF_100660 [Reticulibacter mediterranei]